MQPPTHFQFKGYLWLMVGCLSASILTFAGVKTSGWANSTPTQNNIAEPSSQNCSVAGNELIFAIKPLAGQPQVTADVLEKAITVFKTRLEELNISPVSVQAISRNQLQVHVPNALDLKYVTQVLTTNSVLEFRVQKPGTEATLMNELSIQQALRSELGELEADLKQAGGKNTRLSNQIARKRQQLQQTQAAILKLFVPTELTGASLKDVYADPSSAWSITVTFHQADGDQFAQLTKSIAGTQRALGIVINGEVVSAALVDTLYAKTGITGGRAVITGNFTETGAKKLAAQLRSGVLPAQIQLVSTEAFKQGGCSP